MNAFRFKQFSVAQERCAMKVGTDGVLLGAWCPIETPISALDIGTGTGLIALMIAQRSPETRITAVEIDDAAAAQAAENFMASRWSSRLTLVQSPLQAVDFGNETFDLIVCNPPFYVDALKAPDPKRLLARHNDALPFDALAEHVARLLSDDGRFALILPPTEAQLFETEARKKGLFPCSATEVRTTPKSGVRRRLMLFERKQCPLTSEELIIESAPLTYTEAYKALTRDFYLHF